MNPRLSIVIPAYNEEKRLPRTLDKVLAFLNENYQNPYEIIIVDDGSTDNTVIVTGKYAEANKNVRLIKMAKNQGRGAAVREGVLAALGEIVLETDADGSVEEEAITRFASFLEEHPGVDVLIGSRSCRGAEVLTPQPFLRVALGEGFLYLAKILFGWGISDYTLGFKMFRRKSVSDIFRHQFDNRYVAEAEIVFVAQKRGWSLKELPVLWTDYRESRVRPFRDSLRSLKGLVQIISRRVKGQYK